MEKIAEGADLISLGQDRFRILDRLINKISIYTFEYNVIVEIYFDTLFDSGQKIMLRFKEIQEYGFYNSSESKINLHYVERYKFFITDGLYYFSYDPYDEEEKIDERDNDFVISKVVEGYII